MYYVSHPNQAPTELPTAKGYRIDKKTGTLTLWGRHFRTIAAYPQNAWTAITQIPPTSTWQDQQAQ
ncbi:hypothetical protein [Bifidobacterium aemilianum]|uniref:hypothetical protein n=1 Tax=Bifidobacterium aemilianum TaxID=2493120 RepID=UPI001375149C|nr:hypothetical protein [Bifidobacterium aemilianum]